MTIILNVAERFPVSLVLSIRRRCRGRGRKLLTISSSSLEPLFQPNWTLFFEKDLSLCKCRPHRLLREKNLELLKICSFFQHIFWRKKTISKKSCHLLEASLVMVDSSLGGLGLREEGEGDVSNFYIGIHKERSSQTPNAVKASLSRVESVWIIYGQDKMFNVWCKFIFIWTVV